jgi:Flp pilus assembly protein TadD
VLLATKNDSFRPTLTTFRGEAADDPGKISALATWQMQRISGPETLMWLRTLAPAMQTNLTVEVLVAECCTMDRDWSGLQSSIEKQHWAELEFFRHAFLSLALRGQGLADSAKAEWELAVQASDGRQASLAMLLRLAAQWHWQNEAEEILRMIVNRYPTDQGAVQALSQMLFVEGRTRSLMQLYGQETKLFPSSLSMKNNLAMTALLLGAQELKPNDLAREVYQAAPTNPSYVSTYAFSLYLQGKTAEALKVMKTLSPGELQNPSVAGYYGLILKATGDRAKARAYLAWTAKAPLLPEEKNLFDQAKAGL